MTNEEAKHIVDVAFDIPQAVRRAGESRTYHEDEIREAKNMAIKALSVEPCEDCISRESAIRVFGDVHPMDYNTQVYIARIQYLPSVKPQYTEAEIQKMQELEQAQLEKAYEIGKAEGEARDEA